jgi:hypothetical protein
LGIETRWVYVQFLHSFLTCATIVVRIGFNATRTRFGVKGFGSDEAVTATPSGDPQ